MPHKISYLNGDFGAMIDGVRREDLAHGANVAVVVAAHPRLALRLTAGAAGFSLESTGGGRSGDAAEVARRR